jgi:hypothetical protein
MLASFVRLGKVAAAGPDRRHFGDWWHRAGVPAVIALVELVVWLSIPMVKSPRRMTDLIIKPMDRSMTGAQI